MPERIYKLQPDRTLALRGFDTFASAASIHSASPAGFTISGTFRDPADFAVAVLYDADNYYEHPSIKYLPDFNFAGLTLSFDVKYSDGVQPIDSPKYNWIDWATLDCVLADGSTPRITLFDHATLVDSAFPVASGTFTLTTSSTVQPYDRITLWHLNRAFDYVVPADHPLSAAFSFYAGVTGAGVGTVHSITINGTTYPYTEMTGDSSSTLATKLANLVNGVGGGAADPLCSAAATGNTVTLTVRSGQEGIAIPLSASDGNAGVTIYQSSPATVAAALAAQINGTSDWMTPGPTHALMATASGASVTIKAARYGTVNVTGTQVAQALGAPFSGLMAGDTILIAGAAHTVASVQSPSQLTLTVALSLPVTGALYVAPRGGRDGNLITMYALSKNSTLATTAASVQFSGGSSNVTWNCNIDFTALGIDQMRQCWLTFAPSLTNGTAYTATEWDAVFSDWTVSGAEDTKKLQVAGPGSVRIEETDSACRFTPAGAWTVKDNLDDHYSKYFALYTNNSAGTVTVEYTCQFPHNLYVGTSLDGTNVLDSMGVPHLVSDRAIMAVSLDGVSQAPLNCRLNTGNVALLTRRCLATSVAPGTHTVTLSMSAAGKFYFDFLEAAVLSDVPDALPARTNVSPALDFDTDHTYKLPPARLMWIMDKLGYAGPMNEYLGVFWWNERVPVGITYSTAEVTFSGSFADGDSVILTLNGTAIGKSVFPTDTPGTIAHHFARFINTTFVGSWASATDAGVLTITGRSPAGAYTVSLPAPAVISAAGSAAVTLTPVAGTYGPWSFVIDDTATEPVNRATRDWHADFYGQCFSRGREVVTACSMELVYPPDGYVARFHDGSAVATATGFGSIISNHCAIGSPKMVAYQKAVYRSVARMQAAAGLTPWVQFGEFLWWFNASPGVGMALYDSDTTAAASATLGRALYTFMTPADDPGVNSGADAVFLRNRLRDHVAALVSDIRSAYPTVRCEVLWPYDVNYPQALPLGSSTLGGQLNRFINLPVEWQSEATSGLDRIKVEALAFSTGMRSLDLANQAIQLFPGFGWPLDKVTYLVPVFGQATPWVKELAYVWAMGLKNANFWAFDHICLFNLQVPEGGLQRRSVVKAA